MFKPPAETPQEFQARISKQREEQIIAEERRQREAEEDARVQSILDKFKLVSPREV